LRAKILTLTGEETSLAQEYEKERSIRMRQEGKWYILRNVFDPQFEERLCAIEIRNLSPGLENCTKENYLGKSKYGQTILTKRGKANLIGLFVERLE